MLAAEARMRGAECEKMIGGGFEETSGLVAISPPKLSPMVAVTRTGAAYRC
jgi:hypothetical protein